MWKLSSGHAAGVETSLQAILVKLSKKEWGTMVITPLPHPKQGIRCLLQLSVRRWVFPFLCFVQPKLHYLPRRYEQLTFLAHSWLYTMQLNSKLAKLRIPRLLPFHNHNLICDLVDHEYWVLTSLIPSHWWVDWQNSWQIH